MRYVCPECGANIYVAYTRMATDRFKVDPDTGESDAEAFETEDQGDCNEEVYCLGPQRHDLNTVYYAVYASIPNSEYTIERFSGEVELLDE